MTQIRTVFLHFPKTGGTSLARFLKSSHSTNYHVDRWRDLDETKKTYSELLYGHLMFDQIKDLQTKCYLITLLRHPIERTISFYFHVKRSPSHPNYQLAQELTLDEFAQSGAGSQQYLTQLTASIKTENNSTQLGFDGTVKDRLIIAKSRLAKFDHIATTNRLIHSMKFLSQKFDVSSVETKRQNVGGHNVTRDDLSMSAIDAIRHKAWADIELYEEALKLSSG